MEAQRAVVPRGEQAPELVARRPDAHDELVAARRAVDDDTLFPVPEARQQLDRVAGVVRVQRDGRVRAQVEIHLG